MRGMNIYTGGHLEGIAHLKQSITNILTTPIGSRVMRREYGSRLFEKIDRPLNGELVAEIYSDVVEALYDWESRFEVIQVTVQDMRQGMLILELEGRYLANGETIKLEGIEIRGGEIPVGEDINRHDVYTEDGEPLLTDDERPLLY
ncbi:MAG: GPW/gp25 family protein [Alphaproteobacteria bacterium]